MFSMFRRKTAPVHGPDDQGSSDLLQPMTPGELLATPRRQRLLKNIWQRTAVSRLQFTTLYLAPIERYAALVQQFPASESHHHAYPGGMLDHGLEIVAYALKLRQSHLLPIGSMPETQTSQAEAWTAGAAYAALLHDIGKIVVDLEVEYANGKTWHPWHGPLRQPYRFRYRKGREYRLHNAATGLLYNHILDSATLDWLSTFPLLWSALLYLLAGQYEHAGILGQLVIKADQASVAQALGGDPAKAISAPKHALQRKLLDGLRFLLKETLRLNQSEASDGWLTDDALWLVSKTVSDKLRAHLLSQGIEGIPSKNTVIFDVLQEHGIAQAAPNGKAIWSATIKSDSGWTNTFTFFKVLPALIWEPDNRPEPFKGTVVPVVDVSDTASEVPQNVKPNASTKSVLKVDSLDAVLDLLGPSVMTEPTAGDSESLVHPTNAFMTESAPDIKESPSAPTNTEASDNDGSEPSGAHFIAWLREAILSKKLIINDAQALVHTVADMVFLVSPGLFMRYAQQHLQVALIAKEQSMTDWEWTQKQFEHLKLHRKQPNGLNIWTCIVSGPRKTRKVHGYLLTRPNLVMPDILFNNPYLRLDHGSEEH